MNVEPSDELTRTLRRLKKKDPALFRQVQKKISNCLATFYNHKITQIYTNLFYQTLRKFDQNASRKEKLYQKNFFSFSTG